MLSEKAKMLRGELYRGGDPELIADYRRGQVVQERFNASSASDPAARRAMLEAWLGEVGPEVVVRPSLRCDYGAHVRIGARTFINFDCVFLDCNLITIGADVQIAPGVHIYTATHPLDLETRLSGLESAHPVTIGDGAWLGGGCRICPGVTVGAGTVVGAGSVVVRDLPPGVLAAGNPCRVIRDLPMKAAGD